MNERRILHHEIGAAGIGVGVGTRDVCANVQTPKIIYVISLIIYLRFYYILAERDYRNSLQFECHNPRVFCILFVLSL